MHSLILLHYSHLGLQLKHISSSEGFEFVFLKYPILHDSQTYPVELSFLHVWQLSEAEQDEHSKGHCSQSYTTAELRKNPVLQLQDGASALFLTQVKQLSEKFSQVEQILSHYMQFFDPYSLI